MLLRIIMFCCIVGALGQDFAHGDFRRIINTVNSKIETGRRLSNFLARDDISQLFHVSPKWPDAVELIGSVQANAADGLSGVCLNASEEFVMGLTNNKTRPWALKMIDAAGKLGPSLLRDLRLTWLGSYHECVEINATSVSDQLLFNGQYCLANIPIKLPVDTSGSALPVPQGISLRVGLCTPNVCNSSEVKALLIGAMETVNALVPFVHINTSTPGLTVDCKHPDRPLDTKAIVAITILAIFGGVILLATLYDVYLEMMSQSPGEENGRVVNDGKSLLGASRDYLTVDEYTPLVGDTTVVTPGGGGIRDSLGVANKLLLAFSVYTNGHKLLSTRQSGSSLRSVHGVRFLSMSWVILGHSITFALFNAGDLGDAPIYLKRWTFQAIANATVSVDSFFVLSGLLVTYLTLKELKENEGKLNWLMFYAHRYWRLTPAYLLVMMVYVCLMPYAGSGPMWNEKSDPNCASWWWTNALYINNFVHSKSQCMAWSWYLANDMQFYVISPLIIYPLYRFKLMGLFILLVLSTGSMITAGVISSLNHLAPGSLTLLNLDPNEGPDGWDDLYVRPYTRISAYLVGMLFGYLLFKTQCKVIMNKAVVLLCWAVAAFLCLSVLYGLYDVWQNHPLDNSVAAFYNATFRFAWSLGVGWVIFACCSGYGGFINTLLSWPVLIPLSRLTYCAYLCHPAIMFWYYQSQETLIMNTDNNMIYYFLANMVAAYASAFVFSLMFESPLMAVERVLRGKRK